MGDPSGSETFSRTAPSLREYAKKTEDEILKLIKTILLLLLAPVIGFACGLNHTTSAYNPFEKLSRSFTATQNGYLYVANESNASAAASV